MSGIRSQFSLPFAGTPFTISDTLVQRDANGSFAANYIFANGFFGGSCFIQNMFGTTANFGNLVIESTSGASRGTIFLGQLGSKVAIGGPSFSNAPCEIQTTIGATTTGIELLRLTGAYGPTLNQGVYMNFANGSSVVGQIRSLVDPGGGSFIGIALSGLHGSSGLSEGLRILGSGNIGVANTNPTAMLEVGNNVSFTGQRFRVLGFAATPGTDANIEIGDGSGVFWKLARTSSNSFQTDMSDKWGILGGNVGIGITLPSHQLQLSIDDAAKPSTNTWTIASDLRLKNVHGYYTRGLTAVLKINPIYFNYQPGNSLNLPSDVTSVGIIAQDIKDVIPECITTHKNDEYLRFNSDAVSWAVINAIKDLNSENQRMRKILNFTIPGIFMIIVCYLINIINNFRSFFVKKLH